MIQSLLGNQWARSLQSVPKWKWTLHQFRIQTTSTSNLNPARLRQGATPYRWRTHQTTEDLKLFWRIMNRMTLFSWSATSTTRRSWKDQLWSLMLLSTSNSISLSFLSSSCCTPIKSKEAQLWWSNRRWTLTRQWWSSAQSTSSSKRRLRSYRVWLTNSWRYTMLKREAVHHLYLLATPRWSHGTMQARVITGLNLHKLRRRPTRATIKMTEELNRIRLLTSELITSDLDLKKLWTIWYKIL